MQSAQAQQRDLIIALAVIGFAAFLAYTLFTPIWPPDLSALYFAAWFYADGQLAQVYAAPETFFSNVEAPSWRALAVELGHPEADIVPYLYPPLWTLLLAPLAKALPPFAFFKLVFVLNISALGASILLARRIMSPTKVPATLWALFCIVLLAYSTIGITTLYYNQPQIFVSFLVLFSIERLRAGAPLSAGLLLAFAAALKVTPILFVLLFVAERQWRAVGTMIVALAAFGLVSWAAVPTELHAAFFERLAQVQSVLPMMHINYSLQSLLGWFFAAGQMPEIFVHEEAFVWEKPSWISPAGMLIMLAGMAWTWWITRGLDHADRFRIGAPAMFVLINLCGPLSWAHYFVPLMLFLPGFATLFKAPTALLLIASFALAWNSKLQGYLKGLGSNEFYTVQWNVAVLLAFFLCLMAAAYGLKRRRAAL
jgi:hypothetical protein